MIFPTVSVLLLPSLLPCLVAGNDQVPLVSQAANWLEKAKAYMPSSAAAVVTNAGQAIAEPVKERAVEKINIRNYQRKLGPKADGAEEWVIYLTGENNKTCLGDCEAVDLLWNQSIPLFSALPQPNLHLGRLDCAKEAILCTAWQAVAPAIFHFLVPSTEPPNQKTPLRIFFLNHTTTTVDDIVSIPSGSKSRYLEQEEYSGQLHPFDSVVAKLHLLEPLGYLIWTVGNTPSWVIMLFLSFASRHIMSKRMAGRSDPYAQGQLQRPAQGGSGGAGAPVAAPAAKRASNPRGSVRKRA